MGLPYFAPEWSNFGAIASRVLPAVVGKRSYLRLSIVPRATLLCKWMGRRHFLFLERPDFIQATISRWLFYFHHFIHCESDRARLAALVTMQLCGSARSRKISRENAPDFGLPRKRSLPLQCPTFWSTI